MASKIRQIADLAQVSTATVSLALNNKPGVAPSTRARILSIQESLARREGTQSFRQLIKGSVRFLKIVKHSHIVNRDHDVFVASYIEGMDKEARKHGYNLEITHISAEQIQDFIDHLNSSPSKGLIILGTELSADDILAFESVNVPVVVIDTSYEFIRLDFVDMNNIEALFRIVGYLKGCNHRDIGFLWGEQVEARNFVLRREGFELAMRYHDLPFTAASSVLTVDSTFNEAYQGVLGYLRRGLTLPTALVCANDLIASACLKAFKEAGIRVPEDVSLVGFDNLPMCEMLDPPLTTMQVSKHQIGERAMEILAGRLANRISVPTLKLSVGAELIVRNSVRCLAPEVTAAGP